jgi:hypothetical protein
MRELLVKLSPGRQGIATAEASGGRQNALATGTTAIVPDGSARGKAT